MCEIETNNAVDTAVENAISRIVEKFKTSSVATITRESINREQAVIIADKFRAKGYHHEIRMHTNAYGRVFFYCLNVSKTAIRTNDARYSWSEYVR